MICHRKLTLSDAIERLKGSAGTSKGSAHVHAGVSGSLRATPGRKATGRMTILERVQALRADATVLKRYGDRRTAKVLERLAAELEADSYEAEHEVVTLARAVELTGYSRGHLRRLIASGSLRNVGSVETPQFVASELPRKPRQVALRQALALPISAGVSLRRQVARAVVSGD